MKYKNQRNPILPLNYHIPDSEGHAMPDGKLYIYGSYDDREDVFCSEKYYVVSTPDMKEWTIHEESLNGKQIPWFNDPDAPKYPGIDWSHPTPFIQKMIQRDLENGVDMKAKFEEEAKEEKEKPALLFAPDCIEKDGKYYLYFCMPDDSEGVAVADSPEGPFKNPIQLPCGGIDPAIFIDDDGQAYFYWGQLFSHGVKLNPDMMSFNREEIMDDLVTEEEHYFHEGSSMRKIGDNYYYVYADMERGKPTSLGYSMSKSPLGPFEYKGIIIDNDGCDPASWNNHGSIECVNGQWYVFYHRCSQGMQQHRRLCIEKIQILEDGTIPEVKMTSQGVGDPFGPGEMIMGYQACEMSGTVYIGLNKAEEQNQMRDKYPEILTNISDGDEVIFRYVKIEKETETIEINCKGSAKVSVLLDNRECGLLDIQGDGKKLAKACGAVNMKPGIYELKLKITDAEEFEIYDVTLTK